MNAYRESSLNNQLLASLPPEAAHVVQPLIESVELSADTMLYEAGTVLRHVYFPVTAVVSLVSPLQDGACAEVAVVGVPDERLGEVSIALILPAAGSLLSEQELRDFLIQRLASFKVPERFIFVSESLPRLGTGKIDRVALKAQLSA